MAIELGGRAGRLGSLLGQGAAQGIESHLNQLAQQKLLQLKGLPKLQEKEAARQAFIKQGLDPALADLPQSAIKGLVTEKYKEGKADREANLLESVLGSQQPYIADYQQDGYATPEPQQSLMNQLTHDQETGPRNKLPIVEQGAEAPLPIEEQVVKPKEQPKQKGIFKSAPFLKYQNEINKLSSRLNDPDLTPIQKQQVRKKIEELEDRGLKQQEAADKKSEAFYDETVAKNQAGIDSDTRLERMIDLITSGQLNGPLKSSIVNRIKEGITTGLISIPGIDLSGLLLSQESQEFNKESTKFIESLKNIFGGKVTNEEMKRFLDTIPTLFQSEEGKIRVINNMLLMNEASRIKFDTMKEIIKENGGYRPSNLADQVEDRAKKQLDDISRRFKEGIRVPNKKLERYQISQIPRHPVRHFIRWLNNLNPAA